MKQTVPNRHRALPHRKQRRRRLLATFLVAIAPIRQGPVSARSRARLVRSPQSRSTTEIVTSRYRPHAPFGIGAEQLLGVGELGPSPPTEQAVDREISLNVVDKEQMGVLARKPGLLHVRGNHLLRAALDNALGHAGVRVVIRVEQIIVIVCRRALAKGIRLRSFERGRGRATVLKPLCWSL